MSEYVVKSSEILEGYIYNAAGEHCICKLRAVLAKDKVSTVEGCSTLLVLNSDEQEEQKKKLFHGFIDKIGKPVSVFGDIEVTITAYSATIVMARKESTYVYQNQSLGDMIELICGDYHGDSIIASDQVSNSPKGCYLQYKENDWEFLCSMVKEAGAQLWADCKSLTPRIYINDLLDLKSSYQMQTQLYFYNRKMCRTSQEGRGSHTIFKSGVTETLYEASRAVYNRMPVIPPGWTMVDSVGLRGMGFSAMTLQRNDNFIIAFRGTDDLADLKNDLDISQLLSGDGQQLQAKAYLRRIVERYPRGSIYMTGHSLGGNLALAASVCLAAMEIDERLVKTEYFNGLGRTSLMDRQSDIDKIMPKTYSNEIKGDGVSEFGYKAQHRTIYGDKGLEDLLAAAPAIEAVYQAVSVSPFRRIEADIVGSLYKAGVSAKHLITNHVIDKFYPLYTEKEEFAVKEKKYLAYCGKITLSGTVTEVYNDKFKVAFSEDRVPTGKEKAFEFTKSANYKDIYMMPAVGDTVYIVFNKNAFDNSSLFQSAICSKVQRK